jgi:membrane glycosyltransferase
MDLVTQALAETAPPDNDDDETFSQGVVGAGPTPTESRLSMPAQNIFKFESRQRRPLAAPQLAVHPWLARLVAFGGGAALTVHGGLEMYKVIDVGGVTMLKWALLGLFVLNFSWIALSFSSSLVGLAMLLRRRPTPIAPQQLAAKTAVVMPIYNETPSRVFAALQIIFEDVQRSAPSSAFGVGWGRLARACSTGGAKRTPAARPAILAISSRAGAALTLIWSCSTPTA